MVNDYSSVHVNDWVGDSPDDREDVPVSCLLKAHKTKHNIGEESSRIKIHRDDLWEHSFALFKNPNFDLKASPFVKFEDEFGIDAGGVSREYFMLLMRALFESTSMFEGQEGRKLLVYSADAIYGNLFSIVGEMVSYAICHGEIGIPCLAPPMYEYLASGDLNKSSTLCGIDDIPDLYLVEIITRVQYVVC